MLTKIENINLSNNITKCKVSADNTCGLLHALGEITPANVTSTPTPDETIGSDDNDDELKVFQSRHSRVNGNHQERESVLKFAYTNFEKHAYGQLKKYTWVPIKDFDPRPIEY